MRWESSQLRNKSREARYIVSWGAMAEGAGSHLCDRSPATSWPRIPPLPSGDLPLGSVIWTFRRRRATRPIYRWESRLRHATGVQKVGCYQGRGPQALAIVGGACVHFSPFEPYICWEWEVSKSLSKRFLVGDLQQKLLQWN